MPTCGPEVWHATVCVALGFYLASTSFAPEISQFTESLSRLLSERQGKARPASDEDNHDDVSAAHRCARHEKGPAYDQPI